MVDTLKRKMFRTRAVLFLSAALSAAAASAASEISHTVVNQRWRWSEDVDVDFVLSGDACDVEVSARWDAHPAPFRLGTVFAAAPGAGRFTWNPSSSAFAGQTLTGFSVTLSASAPHAHDYLVVDLAAGGYEFMAEPPAGGWTGEYKSSKMVFRRVPAGTYVLGEPKDTFTYLGLSDSSANTYSTIWNRRTATFTSDFYVGIFKYTEAQHECLVSGTPGSSFKPKKISYYSLRGNLDAADWPAKGYDVSPGSIVAKLRAKAGEGLLADLCEEDQWEVAARAGTSTILPNGATAADPLSVFTNRLDEVAAWYGTVGSAEPAVGLFAPNPWGLYDVSGLAGEWTLDSAVNIGTQSLPRWGLDSRTDPVGSQRYPDGSGYRIYKNASANWSTAEIHKILPCARQMADPASEYTCSTRFCIHLKPLVKDGGSR